MGSVQKFDNSKQYSAGGGARGKNTFLMMNPKHSMSKNKELAKKMRSISNDETEKALLALEDKYQSGSNLNGQVAPGINPNAVEITKLAGVSSD